MKTYEIKELFHLINTGASDTGSELLTSEIHWSSASKVRNHLKASNSGGTWHEEESWGDYPYRSVWINLEKRQVLTYCEGDVSLTQSTDSAQFYSELSAASKFYQEN